MFKEMLPPPVGTWPKLHFLSGFCFFFSMLSVPVLPKSVSVALQLFVTLSERPPHMFPPATCDIPVQVRAFSFSSLSKFFAPFIYDVRIDFIVPLPQRPVLRKSGLVYAFC
jgi:hypothetical protein